MKILLAIDDSEFSEAATRVVLSAVRPQGTEVLVAHVLEAPAYSAIPEMRVRYGPELNARFEDEEKQANQCVAKAAEVLRREGFRADTRVVEGEARAGILRLAEEWRADLIVAGSHGRKGLERFLLGSVAEYVARQARCSVWIVRIPRRRSEDSTPARTRERA
jgi:nucleotide-binding universal stress UspA family protein